VPLAPEAMVIHGTELLAVHAHVFPVFTCTVRNAVDEVSDTLVVESARAQPGAAWVTENTRPPIVIVPVLTAFVVLAAVA
jgi:hypothetical protein